MLSPHWEGLKLPSACVVRESAFHGRALRTMSNPNALLSFARTLHQTHGGSFRQSEGNRPLRATTGANLKTEAAQNAPNLNALKTANVLKTGLKIRLPNRANPCERIQHARKNPAFADTARNFFRKKRPKVPQSFYICGVKRSRPHTSLRRLCAGVIPFAPPIFANRADV